MIKITFVNEKTFYKDFKIKFLHFLNFSKKNNCGPWPCDGPGRFELNDMGVHVALLLGFSVKDDH